jgi:hypothetical protein
MARVDEPGSAKMPTEHLAGHLSPAEAFRRLLRALLRVRGCPESLADEVDSYTWFRQFQSFRQLAPGKVSLFERGDNMDTATTSDRTALGSSVGGACTAHQQRQVGQDQDSRRHAHYDQAA